MRRVFLSMAVAGCLLACGGGGGEDGLSDDLSPSQRMAARMQEYCSAHGGAQIQTGPRAAAPLPTFGANAVDTTPDPTATANLLVACNDGSQTTMRFDAQGHLL